MSIEQALIARSRAYMLRARARQIVQLEWSKGCDPHLADRPVALEPVYEPIIDWDRRPAGRCLAPWVGEAPWAPEQLARWQVWISPRQTCDWVRSELFVKGLGPLTHRMVFEVFGNQAKTVIQLLCHRQDWTALNAAFRGPFERCELSSAPADGWSGISPNRWGNLRFYDFYPSPPYSHLFTCPEELGRAPITLLINVFQTLPASALGFYQVIFAPTSTGNDWYGNIQALHDNQYFDRLLSSAIADPRAHLQQGPSGDLRHMAMDVELKAHNDRRIFAAALRTGVLPDAEDHEGLVRALSVVPSLIQHGGQPLNALIERDYLERFDPDSLREMFQYGLVYRPGFLLNSRELSSLVHLPPPDPEQIRRRVTVFDLETLRPPEQLRDGTLLGYCDYAGEHHPICIPSPMRCLHTHAVGKPSTGKSTLLLNMILRDIDCQEAVIVIDPHGDLCTELLCRLGPERWERIIYLDPGDPDWVPLWNPMQCLAGRDIGRAADDLVTAFKSYSTGWGDRLEHLLRNLFFVGLSMPGSTLLDAYQLLRKTDQNKRRWGHILNALDNEVAREFWRHDLEKYGKDDLGPVRNKLSKLLLTGTVSRMLSQPDNRIDFRQIMDQGQALIVNLSNIGSQVRDILGCLILSTVCLTALGRSSIPAHQRQPAHVYCDEAHRFTTDALEDLIAQMRKYNLSLNLAHQYLRQFDANRRGALSSVNSTIIFNVEMEDARHFRRGLRGRVSVGELIDLEPWQAVARIGTHVVRFRTVKPRASLKPDPTPAIIQHSRERYYCPADQIRRRPGSPGDVTEREPIDSAMTATYVEDLRVYGVF
ncbi:MAG TPA: hypothetical protein PKY77_26185 [Phycisphaerae bacterium]|nr:hypothetical protein [Phycisphaerae bacterium]HRY67694.1 hypothetical protein [Phycisphaerae bacterium]HSA25145.1 hypothetical protein [Phycisphaerae bacterium]